MSDLNSNIGAGLEAVRFVKSKMKLGAGNKLKDILRSMGDSHSCVSDIRSDEDIVEGRMMYLHKTNPHAAVERAIEFTAGAAVVYGCGNCHEQAALAFIYLRDKDVYPLDHVQKPNSFRSFGGHEFVILGRKEGSDIRKPSTWGEDAVVVDPHEQETAYPASKIDQYMSTDKLLSIFRLNKKSDTSIRVKF